MKQSNILKFILITITLQTYLSLYGNIVNDSISNPQFLDDLIKTYAVQCNLEKENSFITIADPDFKSFVTCIVEGALEERTHNNLSNGLLTCYKQLCNDNNTFAMDDLLDALPNLIIELHNMKARGPRPSSSNAVAGQQTCDLSAIENLLNQLLAKLIQCCNTIIADFNGTYSALFDLKNTLTICCEDVLKDFQETWTILGAGFNGTFSLLNTIGIELSNCCSAMIAGLSSIVSELSTIETTINTIEETVDSIEVEVTSLLSAMAVYEAVVIACCEIVGSPAGGIINTANHISCLLSCYDPPCIIVCEVV